MGYIVAIFRSRSESLKLAGYLSDAGVWNKVISTPKEANVGCGLSVKIFENSVSITKAAINYLRLKGFVGFLKVQRY